MEKQGIKTLLCFVSKLSSNHFQLGLIFYLILLEPSEKRSF